MLTIDFIWRNARFQRFRVRAWQHGPKARLPGIASWLDVPGTVWRTIGLRAGASGPFRHAAARLLRSSLGSILLKQGTSRTSKTSGAEGPGGASPWEGTPKSTFIAGNARGDDLTAHFEAELPPDLVALPQLPVDQNTHIELFICIVCMYFELQYTNILYTKLHTRPS